MLAYRDKPVTPAQIGQQLGAAYVLAGSLRRAGNRLRINAQLIDTHTDFPLWSERYDREMQDVFEVQDEIARKIAEALRITLSPQEQAALAAKPTENLQAYDLYLRGKSYARRLTRQDLEFALPDVRERRGARPEVRAGLRRDRQRLRAALLRHGHDPVWIERAKTASEKAMALAPQLPEAAVARGWVLYAAGQNDDAVRVVRQAIERKPDCEGAYYLLGRALFSDGRYQEIADIADAAIQAAGEDYNIYVPIQNALGALGKTDALRNLRQRRAQVLEEQTRKVPEDGRARVMLAIDYASVGRIDDALREANLAMVLRPNEATVLYNAACAFCLMEKKPEALDALRKGLGRRLQGRRLGAPRSRTWRCCTAIRSSSGCIRAESLCVEHGYADHYRHGLELPVGSHRGVHQERRHDDHARCVAVDEPDVDIIQGPVRFAFERIGGHSITVSNPLGRTAVRTFNVVDRPLGCSAPVTLSGKYDPAAPGYIVSFVTGTDVDAALAVLTARYGFQPTSVYRLTLLGFAARLTDAVVDGMRCGRLRQTYRVQQSV